MADDLTISDQLINIEKDDGVNGKPASPTKFVPLPATASPTHVQKPTIMESPSQSKSLLCIMFYTMEGFIYWKDPKKSGPVFGGVLVILLALTYASLISVIAYTSLFALTCTISFRIYKNIMQAVQKTGEGHPFKEYLEMDMSLSQEKTQQILQVAVAHLNAAMIEFRRLFLVEDLVDSIKFGVLLWVLTYLGSWFNGMTLLIMAWVALFTLPKVYEVNQDQINANLEIARTKMAEITTKVKMATPFGKKDEKVE